MAQKPIDRAKNQGTSEKGTTQQKVLNELDTSTPAGVPQRVATNTDPTKPVTQEQLQPIAAQNSNEKVQAPQVTPGNLPVAGVPQGMPTPAAQVGNEVAAVAFDTAVTPKPMEMSRAELDQYRKQKGLTPEQKKEADAVAFKWMEGSMPQQKGQFPGAVDPNSPQYAQQQQATYQGLTQRAATEGLTTSEKSAMFGGDFMYKVNTGTPGMPGTEGAESSIATRLATSPAAAGTKASTALDTAFQNYLGDRYEQFKTLPPEKQQALKSKWAAQATKAGLLKGITDSGTQGVQASGGTGNQGLNAPGSTSPIKTAGQRDEQMLRIAQDTTAAPEAREQAQAYINVKRMWANPAFAAEKKAFQQAERNWLGAERNFFKNTLNRRDPRYKDRYRDYRNFQRGDARTKLAVYTQLLKNPRFASLGYK